MKYILALLTCFIFLLGACVKDEAKGKEPVKQTQKESKIVPQGEILEALEKIGEIQEIHSEFGVQENPSESLDKVTVKKRFRTIMTEGMYQDS